ncbi:MAG TPA: hypothetical protein P5567_10095 [Kiritimatiellia bacterium]|nr:hypothetical protein [Kiritimatiellia bacterium]HRZ12791.1 hypothetical protein [Kiritimatiellia bacterium]HSA18257.1 hypothetical protein [Kiritimatiellia bacterium]
MKTMPDESILKSFRVPGPAPELRARILASARLEWKKRVLPSEWSRLRNPLRALAASIAVAVLGQWANGRLAASPNASVARVREPLPRELTELADRPAVFLIPAVPAADLSSRQAQLRDLLEGPAPLPDMPAPQGQTYDNRQTKGSPASCC